ncbi:glycine cleavage system aminomethyltransferase GcvT [Phormidium sp. LEGE 05292]|uniref:glycine cleavage system aminomethyltransferase GcvT n=1 Tax=[Phormidium] sp. LEGE 05292 TaxID=767427 RepID=UPI0018828EE9|nr:glycine cleavage system aminomethyltransferase GcvT [Phormidium sp. LEGE 05292]MBE9229653.1 glycine cleavage system aminomethyltransferase GcvT [Phormidium sp. LEGE 05292]
MSNQSTTPASLSRTPLYNLAVESKARFTEFSGWEMPVQFGGIAQEHQAVRTASGMFDISHMGKFTMQGKNLIFQLQSLIPSDLSSLQTGQAQYSVLLNSEGGIIDDIIFYYQGEAAGIQQGVMIVNAATRPKDRAWLLKNLETSEIDFQDISQDKVLIAVQGPQGIIQLQKFVQEDLNSIKSFGHLLGTVLGKLAFIARTGYTGEDGFEVMVDPDVGVELWRNLLAEGVVPCGLGARDTLRLEAAMALYGQDINEGTTPLEAGLGWLVHLDRKGEFIGRQILEEQKASGVERKLVGLQMQGRNIARQGYPISYEGETVGEVTSGSWSPTLECAIALAYLPTNLAKIGQELQVEIRGKFYPAKVVKKPFYRSPNKA